MERFIDFVLKHYKLTIIFFLLLAIILGNFISNIKLNNTVDMYFEKDDPQVLVYENFRKTFGNEEAVVILFKDDNLFSNEKLKIVRDISQMARELISLRKIWEDI